MSRSAKPGPSTIRRSEPPRRSTRYRSQVTQSTDNSGAEDLPYLPIAPTAAEPTSASRRARSTQSARAHRKTASFSRIVNLDVEVDVESALNRSHHQGRRSRDPADDETRSERTVRSVRRRHSSTVDDNLTPRGSSKKKKWHVRRSLGVSQVIGEMTLDRRAEMVSDVARDCLVKLLAISRRGGGEEARKAWDSLQVLRQTYMFSKHAPPFADLHSFISALHPGNAYNPLVLSHALDLSNICTFIYTILFPDEASDLVKDIDPYFLENTHTGHQSLRRKGKSREEDLEHEVGDGVKRRNQLLLMAWKKFWVVVIPREMRGSDSALKLWLDFATMIIQTWQSPTIFPISPSHASLPEIPETVLTELLSPSSVTRFGQWELSDDLNPSDTDYTDRPDQVDTEQRAVVRRWRDLIRRRKQVLEERQPEILSRQFNWSRFASELCAFVRVELADGGYLPTGVQVKRAESEISVKRRLSSNTSNLEPLRYSLTLPRRTEEELGEDDDDVDIETADSALEESEADDREYDRPETQRQTLEGGDEVNFDMLKDLAMEMDEETEELARYSPGKRDQIPSGRSRSTLSPKKRLSTSSPPKSRSSLPNLRAEDGYTADLDTLREYRVTPMQRQITRSSKPSTSPTHPDDEEWAIRDMLPATQDLASRVAGPSRRTFNFAARQVGAERVNWDSQTPVRAHMNGRSQEGGVIQRDYAEDRDHTPRPREYTPPKSLTRPNGSAIPIPAADPVDNADVHTPRRAARDPTQEFVPTPGIFHETDATEAEETEVLENIGLADSKPAGRQSEAPVHTVPELVRPVNGGVSGSSEILRTPSQDINDILPDPALLELQAGATVSRGVSRPPGPAVANSLKRPRLLSNVPREVETNEEDGDIVYIEQPVRPTAQGPFISSRPRSSAPRPGDFVRVTAAEEEADRTLLSHPATPRHRQSTTTTDIKPLRDPDFLIAPGLRRQSNQRAASRAPFARIHSVQPAEPDLDPYMFDENNEPLEEDDEYVLPLNYEPQRSMVHGRLGEQSTSYSRLSGKRKWTKPEEILLYRTVQKVPLREEYPLRVVWYLHGEFGVLSQTLADFNPQHMKDKMRVIVSARYNQRKPVLGRARFWLSTGHPDKMALAEEMQEWKRQVGEQKAEERRRILQQQAREKEEQEGDQSKKKKGRTSKSKGKKRAREEEETEEDELESHMDLESEGEKGDDAEGSKVPETADEGAVNEENEDDELTPSKRRASAHSTPNNKVQTPKRGRGRPRKSEIKPAQITIAAGEVLKRTGPSDRQQRAEARGLSDRQIRADARSQVAQRTVGRAARRKGGEDVTAAVQQGSKDGEDEMQAGPSSPVNGDDDIQSKAAESDAQTKEGREGDKSGNEEEAIDETDDDDAASAADPTSHIEQDSAVRRTRSRSRTAPRIPSASTSVQPVKAVHRMRSTRGRGRGRGGIARVASEGIRRGRSSTCEVVLPTRAPMGLTAVPEDQETQDVGQSQEEVDKVVELKVVEEDSADSGSEDEDEDAGAEGVQEVGENEGDEGEEGEEGDEGDENEEDLDHLDMDDDESEAGGGQTQAEDERVRKARIEFMVRGN